MKNVLLLLLLALLTLPIQAQSFRFGAKGGANYADINGKDLNKDSHQNKLTWHAGVMTNIQYPGNTYFSIQPEILYSRKGYENTGPETELKDNQGNLLLTEQSAGLVGLHYIDVPVMFNFKSGIIIFEIGPQVSVLTGVQNEAIIRQTYPDGTIQTRNDDFRRFDKDRVRKLDVGFATGFRLETHNGVGLGIRFNQGFIQLDNGKAASLMTPRAPEARNQVFQLFVSYLLPE